MQENLDTFEADAVMQTNEPVEQPSVPAADGEVAEQEPEPRSRNRSIFISHQQGADNDIAEYLHEELGQLGYDVYLDICMPAGVDWKRMLPEKLDTADYVIVLLSEDSQDSDWVQTEVFRATNRYKQEGRPQIIPVRIGLEADYVMNIGACLNRFVPVRYERLKDPMPDLLEQIVDGLEQKYSAQPASAYGMDSYMVSGPRKEQVINSFIEPSTPRIKSDLRTKKDLVWISGDAEVRNYLAFCLAATEQVSNKQIKAVFDISKPRLWSDINEKKVRNAAIVFRDATAEYHFGEESAQKELESLSKMVKRNNAVFITTDEASFAQIDREMRRLDIADYTHIEVQRGDYNEAAKNQLFQRLLNFSAENDKISSIQNKWALSLLYETLEQNRQGKDPDLWQEARSIFHQRMTEWSPEDIGHFILLSLPQAKSRGDVMKLLQHKLALEDEIHSWLMSLDGSTSCFVMALSIFSGKKENEFWNKYKCIVMDLQRINPQLALLPLGVCRERSAPYVATDGPIEFLDERIASAISKEIAKNFREYFIEILPRLKEWSVPAGRVGGAPESDEERGLRLDESKEIRTAIAQMVGRVGKYRIDDLTDIIDFWATDRLNKVREAAAIALQEIASETSGARLALDLLEQWSSDITAADESVKRAWAAAIALGYIVLANPKAPYSSKALEHLRSLAYDNRYRVRLFVSVSLMRIARRVPLRDLENLLERTARKAREYREANVLINLAAALNQASSLDPQAAMALYDRWVTSPEAKLRWVAFCSLIIKRETPPRRKSQEQHLVRERGPELERLLRHDAVTLVDVLFKLKANDYHQDTAADTIKKIVLGLTDDTRREFARSVAQVPSEDMDEAILSLVKESEAPGVESLIVEIYKERWKGLIDKPAVFLSSIAKVLRQEQIVREGFSALVALLTPEPEGCRQEIVTALASCYAQERKAIHDTFATLKSVAPAHFEPLILEVYLEAYKGLLQDPVAFIRFVNGGLSHPEFSSEMRSVLESLAVHEPRGCHRQLLQVVAAAYVADQMQVKQFLSMLKNSESPVLAALALDVKYSLLHGALSDHATFVASLIEDLQNDQQCEETLGLLQLLAAPGPYGSRLRVIDTLADAKVANSNVVDLLLTYPSLQRWSNLANLAADVGRAAGLRRFFIPRIISDFFRAKR